MIPIEAFASAAWGILAKHWRLIGSALILAGLGIALLLAKADARHWHKVADANADTLKAEKLAHAVSNASIGKLQAAIDMQNKAALERATAYQDARLADAATLASLNARLAADKGRRDALTAIASQPTSKGACVAPDALLKALEGL